jgi:hypothetical protein
MNDNSIFIQVPDDFVKMVHPNRENGLSAFDAPLLKLVVYDFGYFLKHRCSSFLLQVFKFRIQERIITRIASAARQLD